MPNLSSRPTQIIIGIVIIIALSACQPNAATIEPNVATIEPTVANNPTSIPSPFVSSPSPSASPSPSQRPTVAAEPTESKQRPTPQPSEAPKPTAAPKSTDIPSTQAPKPPESNPFAGWTPDANGSGQLLSPYSSEINPICLSGKYPFVAITNLSSAPDAEVKAIDIHNPPTKFKYRCTFYKNPNTGVETVALRVSNK